MQLQLIEDVRDNDRVIYGGCTASTKTFAAAMLIAWWVSAYEVSRVITLAPVFRQVETNIWGYLRTLHREAKIPLGGRMYTDPYWLLEKDICSVQGFSVKEPEYIRGYHGKKDLIIVDDGQGVTEPIYDAIENALAGGTAHLLILANLTKLSGTTYNAYHKDKAIWKARQISAYDTPNVKAQVAYEKEIEEREKAGTPIPPEERKKEIVIIPGAIVKSRVDQWIRKYGINSNFVRTMVLGQFPKQEADTLIPMDWLQMAVHRDVSKYTSNSIIIGADYARFGNDRTVFTPMRGLQVLTQTVVEKFDAIEVENEAKKLYSQLNARSLLGDDIGMGGPINDHLIKDGLNVIRVNVSTVPECCYEVIPDPNTGIRKKVKRYANLRSYIWWKGREALDPNNPLAIALPNDPDLIAEFSCVHYSTPNGVITIESKDEMKDTLGFSPDKADSALHAIYGRDLRIELLQQNTVTVAEVDEDDLQEDPL